MRAAYCSDHPDRRVSFLNFIRRSRSATKGSQHPPCLCQSLSSFSPELRISSCFPLITVEDLERSLQRPACSAAPSHNNQQDLSLAARRRQERRLARLSLVSLSLSLSNSSSLQQAGLSLAILSSLRLEGRWLEVLSSLARLSSANPSLSNNSSNSSLQRAGHCLAVLRRSSLSLEDHCLEVLNNPRSPLVDFLEVQRPSSNLPRVGLCPGAPLINQPKVDLCSGARRPSSSRLRLDPCSGAQQIHQLRVDLCSGVRLPQFRADLCLEALQLSRPRAGLCLGARRPNSSRPRPDLCSGAPQIHQPRVELNPGTTRPNQLRVAVSSVHNNLLNNSREDHFLAVRNNRLRVAAFSVHSSRLNSNKADHFLAAPNSRLSNKQTLSLVTPRNPPPDRRHHSLGPHNNLPLVPHCLVTPNSRKQERYSEIPSPHYLVRHPPRLSLNNSHPLWE